MKNKNPYATLSTKPIVAPKKPSNEPKSAKITSETDMRVKVKK